MKRLISTASNRWLLCMWTAAKMLGTMDFVFHRVMSEAQRGSRVVIITTLALIIAFNLF